MVTIQLVRTATRYDIIFIPDYKRMIDFKTCICYYKTIKSVVRTTVGKEVIK